MRSVSATLEAAQSSTSRTPYIHLVFTSYDGGTTVDLSTDSAAYGNRILMIDHKEDSYGEYNSFIVLRDADRTLPTDLKGYWTEIGYGDVTGGGNEYAATPRLWVKHQQSFSSGGKLYMVLELEGMWAKLRETLMRTGTPPYYVAKNTNPGPNDGDLTAYKTPYDLIDYILTNEVDPAMTLDALAEDDGIIDTFEPEFEVNSVQPFESAGRIIYVLLEMTKSYLRAKASLTWEVKYPQAADSVDLTYYSNAQPKFYEYTERDSILVPNRIIVFGNQGDDLLWNNIIASDDTTYGRDEESITAYGSVYDLVLAPLLISQADVDTRADVIVGRRKAELLSGKGVVKHDCRVELYDYVQFVDYRGF